LGVEDSISFVDWVADSPSCPGKAVLPASGSLGR
jgi:hypothetical protein